MTDSDNKFLEELRAARAEQRAVQERGVPALERLLKIARGESGQCRHVAAFLLSLYNGKRFKFDLTDFRCVDKEIFDDCMLVLAMDRQPLQEVHCYFKNGGAIWEQLAKDWRVPDRLQLRSAIGAATFAGADADIYRAIASEYLDYRAI